MFKSLFISDFINLSLYKYWNQGSNQKMGFDKTQREKVPDVFDFLPWHVLQKLLEIHDFLGSFLEPSVAW